MMGVRKYRKYTPRVKSLFRTYLGLELLKRQLEPAGEFYVSRIRELQVMVEKRLREAILK